jgi:hypothetical protein
MDKVIYFPALLMTLVCSLWVLIMWSKREDYLNWPWLANLSRDAH